MTLDPRAALAALSIVAAVVVPFVGWLLLRAVKGVDSKLDGLHASVNKLAETDTKIQIELAELRTRLVHVEYLVMGAQRRTTSGEVPK